MTDLACTYTADWFRRRARYRAPYRVFAQAIEELLCPDSVLNVGCGAGYLIERLAELGVAVAGVDGSPAVLEVAPVFVRPKITVADLTGPPPVWVRNFWLVTSIEVAEHIPAEREDAFLEWFRWAQRVFFTAAPPGQKGTGHVNCQPQSYWIARFMNMGFGYSEALTTAWRTLVRRETSGCPWVQRNAMIFVRKRRLA